MIRQRDGHRIPIAVHGRIDRIVANAVAVFVDRVARAVEIDRRICVDLRGDGHTRAVDHGNGIPSYDEPARDQLRGYMIKVPAVEPAVREQVAARRADRQDE
ncbi:hypothetical protein SDC9_113200 [bioreactor metagenome]|uniref:Uncharacterized protein n=1 Tax=bioreactor metagenome TaxID=1076179 RepID=A0A645BSS7_9ZZZZ